MSVSMTKTDATPAGTWDPLLGELGRNWGWMLALGLLYLGLGVAGIAMLFGLTIANILFIGILLVAGGTAQLLESIKCKGWKGMVWHVAIAALYIIAGVAVIIDPDMAVRLIALVVGGVLAAVGVARLLLAWQLRAKGAGWTWMALSAVIAIALAVMMAVQWPLPGLFAIALFVAIELLLQGSSTVGLALTARRAARA